MLNIAVIGTWREAKNFIEYKYKTQLKEIKINSGIYTLINGDKLHICSGEVNAYKGLNFDAYIVTNGYETLEDVIKYRCMREFPSE